MTTKPSIGKRLLGVMLAVPMALAGMGIGATTAVAADTVPTDNLIAAYDFTTKPSDGKTVANSAPNATLARSLRFQVRILLSPRAQGVVAWTPSASLSRRLDGKQRFNVARGELAQAFQYSAARGLVAAHVGMAQRAH